MKRTFVGAFVLSVACLSAVSPSALTITEATPPIDLGGFNLDNFDFDVAGNPFVPAASASRDIIEGGHTLLSAPLATTLSGVVNAR